MPGPWWISGKTAGIIEILKSRDPVRLISGASEVFPEEKSMISEFTLEKPQNSDTLPQAEG